MTFQNFRAAFNSIEMEQLKEYLSSNGWLEQVSSGRITFSKQFESSGESANVFVPADVGHPKFRSLLQNLLFSLSVLERREPIEIAGDMARIKFVTAPSIAPVGPTKNIEPPSPRSPHFMLRNTSSRKCDICFTDQSKLYPLEPNQDAIVVLSGTSKPCMIEIAGPVTIHGTHSVVSGLEGHKVLFGLPALTWDINSSELLKWITSNLPSTGSQSPFENRKFTAAVDLESTIKRFCFMAEYGAQSSVRSETLLRAIATLVCFLVKTCEESEEAKNRMFELIRLLLVPVSITFSLDLGHAQSLWNTMQNDDVDLPTQGYHWLKERVNQIATSPRSG